MVNTSDRFIESVKTAREINENRRISYYTHYTLHIIMNRGKNVARRTQIEREIKKLYTLFKRNDIRRKEGKNERDRMH